MIVHKNKRFRLGLILSILVNLALMLGLWLVYSDHQNPKGHFVVVNKGTQELKVYNSDAQMLASYAVSTGLNPGNKIIKGDQKTPEGVFRIESEEESSEWTFDFDDGKGPIKGSFGPYFLRLQVNSGNLFHNTASDFSFTSGKQFVGIGIHGTHLPNLIGSRASHGCIRMKNEDLLSLRATIRPGVPVIIVPGDKDLKQNRQKVSREETKKPKPKREKSKPSKKQSLQKARRNPN